MPKRLALQLIFSLTIIVVIVVGLSSYIDFKTQEKQLLDSMILGADQLSRGKSHGGDVEVNSTPRVGTVFRVTLPLVSDESTAGKQGLSHMKQPA